MEWGGGDGIYDEKGWMRALICEIRNSGQDKYARSPAKRILFDRKAAPVRNNRGSAAQGGCHYQSPHKKLSLVQQPAAISTASYSTIPVSAQRHNIRYFSSVRVHGRAGKFYLYFLLPPLTRRVQQKHDPTNCQSSIRYRVYKERNIVARWSMSTTFAVRYFIFALIVNYRVRYESNV